MERFIIETFDGVYLNYVTDDGVSYNRSEAKRFETEDAAEKEASYLSRHEGVRAQILCVER